MADAFDLAHHAAKQQTRKAAKERISRDAFLYLEPKRDAADFAQCSSCRLRIANPTGKLGCAVMAGRQVKPEGTCALYIEGGGTQRTLADYSRAELGYTERQVRCENCLYGGKDECGLYVRLNEVMPEAFDLNTKIKPTACCNANRPR